ncbi:NRDE family protein [Kaarinaea lacus]
MCTLVILYRQNDDWPIIIGTNRDEMVNRPWLAPARHWPDRSNVIAGLDQLAGGSWLGMNDTGVIAAINNRAGSLGPEKNKRSRGELVLEALDHDTANDAAEALIHLNPMAYRAFNLFIADANGAFWLRHLGHSDTESIEVFAIPPGVAMLTAHDLNDSCCERIKAYLPRFKNAKTPQPDLDDWSEWESLLLSRESVSNEAGGAMRIVTDSGFNTVSSSLIALPAQQQDLKPVWRFARRYPDVEPYQKVSLQDI